MQAQSRFQTQLCQGTIDINKNSTLLLIGVEGYSTPVGKRDRRDPARSAAEEAARSSPTGKRVAWNGNHPH
ncbi:hypothetical protein AMS59_09145 [Lysinibacillus sp. FJAT-14745]|nr:hypothetical protein AMS59_09145 [Lysinibacillus sp. FJAT-14745]